MYHISFFGLSLSPTCSAQRCTTWSPEKYIQEFRILGPYENTNFCQCTSAGLSCEFSIICMRWSHETQRPVRTLTRIQSPEWRMMMLNDTGWMSTANKGWCHINSESPTLSEICPRVWIIFWPAVYGYGESLHQAHNLIARLLLETFSIGTQRIGMSVSPTNLQFL